MVEFSNSATKSRPQEQSLLRPGIRLVSKIGVESYDATAVGRARICREKISMPIASGTTNFAN